MAERVFSGLGSFTRFLDESVAKAALVDVELAEAASIVLQRNIKDLHGSSVLRDLAPRTQAERTRLGYSANEPLLRDGSLLRDNVERMATPGLAAAGSAEPVAGYQEFGTETIPPRPVFFLGMMESEAEVVGMMDEVVASYAGFRPVFRAEEIV